MGWTFRLVIFSTPSGKFYSSNKKYEKRKKQGKHTETAQQEREKKLNKKIVFSSSRVSYAD